MKLNSILTLNEGTYSKLAEWEAAAKKCGYKVTKDNKSGTYHAWEGTTHKGQFTAPTGNGSLTEVIAKPRKPRIGSIAWEREQQRKQLASDPDEIKRIEKIGNSNHTTSSYHGGTAKITHKEGVLNKIADKVMGKAPTNKYKVGDEVSYEMDPPQEGGRGRGKITSVSKAGDHYTVNGKFVNHFEIKKKHTSVKESAGEPSVDDILYYLTSGYRTLQKYADSYQDFSIITRIYNVLRMDLKEGNYIAFSQSYNNYLERYPVAAGELYDAMFEAAGLPADEGTIEEFLQKCSGVTEGTVRYGQPANTQSFKVTYYDPKYDETRTSTIKSRSKDAALNFCAGKGYDVQSIEQQGVTEGLDKQALKQKLDKINAQMALSHPSHQNPNSPTSNRYFELKKQKDAIIAQLKQGVTEGLGDTIKRGVKKLTAPVKDPILDQMKSIADTANKRARAAQNAKYASKAVKEAYTGHFNDDDWYEVDPKTNTVLRHAGGHSDYRPTMSGQPIELPSGNVLMRGMCAKSLRPVEEGSKEKVTTAATQPEYKSVKYKHYSIRQEGPKQWAIVGATVRRFATLLAAQNYVDKRL